MGKCKFTDEFIKNFFNKHSDTKEFIKIDKNKKSSFPIGNLLSFWL